MSTNNEPINLLSFDGGGVRGVTSLLILHKLMITIKEQHGLAEVPKPCEFFHMMAGTSTGGLIAIMLGRLRMSTEEALLEYDRCAGKIFSSKKWSNMSEKFPSTPLRETIQDLVKRRGMGEMMRDPTNPERGKAVICVMPANEVAAPRLVRTFGAEGWDKNIKIWEAARATTAASTFFKPQPLTSGGTTELYIDAAIGINNPSSYLLQEAVKEFGADRKFGCLVSIGTGTRRVQVGRARSGFRTVIEAPKVVFGVLNVVKNTATDGEEAHRQVAGRFKQCKGSYFRFNVEGAAAAAKLHHYGKMGVLKTMTEKYLEKPSVVGQLDEVASLLEHSGYEHGLTMGHIAHLDPTQIVRASPKAHFRSEPSQFFTGREDVLDKLDKFFSKRDTGGKPRRQFLLYGIGGAGKTQIALKFANVAEERFNKVYYIDGTDIVTITQSYARIASEEGWGSGGSEQLRLVALKKLAAAAEEWFLIFDNCSPANRQENIPISNKGNILYTSRDHDLMLEFPDSCVYKVTEMNEEDASRFLLTAAGERYDLANTHARDLARDVVNELGCLPLAVNQAAAYIKAGMCRLDEYWFLFKTERKKWLTNPRFRGASRHDQAVYATFETSCKAIHRIKRLEGNSKKGIAADMAMKTLNLICFLHNEGISVQTPWRALRQWKLLSQRDGMMLDAILETLSGNPDVTPGEFFMTHDEPGATESPYFEGLLMLEKFSLVDLSRDRGFASMHVLAHSWARDRMDDTVRSRYAHMARLIVFESLMESPDIVDDMYLRLAIPHVRACMRYAPSELPLDNPTYEAHLLSNLANLLRLDRRYEEAKVYLEKSIRINKLHAHGNTMAVVRNLESLARIHHEKGDLGAAEAVGLEARHRVVCIWKEKLQFGEIQKEEEERAKKRQSTSPNGQSIVAEPPDGTQATHSTSSEAPVIKGSELPSLKEHYENFSTEDRIEFELSYIGEILANIYYDQGDLKQMGLHFDQCLEIKQRLMPPNDIELWWFQDQAARRTALLRDAQYWAERFFEIQRLQKKYNMQAEYLNHAYLRELAQICADSLVRTRQFTNRFSDELYEIALGQYRKIINAHAAFYNTTDRRVLEMKRMMTVCLIKMGDGDEAEETARKCLELARADYGDWHLETVLSLENLHNALVFARDGCDTEALHLIEQALLRARVSLGMGHRITCRIEKRVDWALDNLQSHLSDWKLEADDELLQSRSRENETLDNDELRIQLFGPTDNPSEGQIRALGEVKESLKRPGKRKGKMENIPHSVSRDEVAAPAGRVRPSTEKVSGVRSTTRSEPATTIEKHEDLAPANLSPADEEVMGLLRRMTDQQSQSSCPPQKQSVSKPAFAHIETKPRGNTHPRPNSNRLSLFSFRTKETQTCSIEMTRLETAEAAG